MSPQPRSLDEPALRNADAMSSTNPELELFKSILHYIVSRVEETKRSIDREIGDYPTPIPRCDAQFNHLLEQRTRLSRLLTRLRVPAEESLVIGGYRELIRDFLREFAT
jgi:hypothetical protein